jgi:hypothetical protein
MEASSSTFSLASSLTTFFFFMGMFGSWEGCSSPSFSLPPLFTVLMRLPPFCDPFLSRSEDDVSALRFFPEVTRDATSSKVGFTLLDGTIFGNSTGEESSAPLVNDIVELNLCVACFVYDTIASRVFSGLGK